MKKIEFYKGVQIQGDFVLKRLNLLLVFQVNCPGCFIYALPMFNQLYSDYKGEEISFLALSTVFEDFDKNTLQNTVDLVEGGKLVGETHKYMKEQGINSLPYSLDFPIAMDYIGEIPDINNLVNNICNTNPNFNLLSKTEKDGIRNNVENYLSSLGNVGLTFAINQLKGTPSIILFNKEYEILMEWFGHTSYEVIKTQIANS